MKDVYIHAYLCAHGEQLVTWLSPNMCLSKVSLSNILLRLSWKIPSYKKQKKEVILFKRFKEMSEAVCSVCLCVQHHAAQTSKNFLFFGVGT